MYNSKDFTPLRSWTIDSDVNVTKQLLKDSFEEVIRATGYKVAVYDIEIDKRLPAISIRNREDDRHMGVYVYCNGNIVEMAIEGRGHQIKAKDLEKVYSKAVGAMRGVHAGYTNTKNILDRFGMRGTGVSIGAGVGVAAGAVIGTSVRLVAKGLSLLLRDKEAYDKEMAFYELAIGLGDYIVGGTDPAGVTKALIKNAEENNDEIAQYLLGNAYCEGRGVEVSLDESIRYYALAAKNGEKRSREILAVEYLYGEREYTVEEKWTGLIYLTELADNGDVAAANSLIDIYGTGDIEGIPADAEKTIEVAEKYAGEGNVYACMILANIYDSDKVSSKVDFDAYKDDKKAFEYYVQLIQHDESSYVEEAAISLAHMHRDSRGVEGNREEELRYYGLAALKGNLEAKSVLASAYTLGLGIDKDHSVAQKLCNELIRSGNKEVLPIAYYCNYVIADEAKKYKVSMENARKYISLENAEEEKKEELQRYLAEQEELISKMTDEERREYLQERKPLFGGFKKKEKGEGTGGNKKIVIAIVAVLAVIVLIFALTKCNGNHNIQESDYTEPEKAGVSSNEEIAVSDEEYYALNIYASNFSEAPLEHYYKGDYSAEELLNFAYQHNFYNNMDMMEWAEDMYYPSINGYDYYNIRISEENINYTLKKYFGDEVVVDALSGLSNVDNYANGYYYSEETGGNMPCGFALLYDIEKNDDTYTCYYYVYGEGYYDAGDVKYYSWSHDQATNEFGYSSASCELKLKASDLNNRDTYHLISFDMYF